MEYIEKIFKKTGWISILESIIFAILGIILINNPEGTIKFVSYALGAIFIIVGIYKMINYISAKGKYSFYNYDFIYGLMAIIIGIITMVCSGAISSIFRIIIGIWIIYSSFMRMSLAIKLKAIDVKVWVYTLILALIMFVCGLYITLNSGTIVVTIGIMIIIYSIIDIIEDIIFMKNVKEIF